MRLLLDRKFLCVALVFSLVYLFLTVYFANWSILNQTYLGHYPLGYKFRLTSSLFEGLWTSMSPISFYSLLAVSALTGLNLALLSKVLKNQAYQKAHLAFGIGSVLGFGGGCASCGLPVIGLLGLSSSVVHLPLKGLEISLIAIGLLCISFYSLYKNLNPSCSIASKPAK